MHAQTEDRADGEAVSMNCGPAERVVDEPDVATELHENCLKLSHQSADETRCAGLTFAKRDSTFSVGLSVVSGLAFRSSVISSVKRFRDSLHQWKHAKIPGHPKKKKNMKSSQDMMNLKRGSLASMKQQQTRRQEYLRGST